MQSCEAEQPSGADQDGASMIMSEHPANAVTLRSVLGRVLRTATVVALLTACGNGAHEGQLRAEGEQSALTPDQYQQAIWDIRSGEASRGAQRRFSDVVGDLSKKDCSDKTHELQDHLAAIMRQVEGLRPPEEAADAQRAFLEAANESVRLVGVAADDVDEGDLTCGTAMNKQIYDMPSTRQAEKAIDELVKLDYNVLGN